MFDSRPLYKELIQIARDRIGEHLSTQSNGTPSIAKEETGVSKLKYPFLTIDRVLTQDAASYRTYSYFDPTDNMAVHQTYKDITFILQLRSQDANAYDVMEHLKASFTREDILKQLEDNCGATVKSTTEVSKTPDPLATTYQRIHAFSLTLSVISEEREDVGYITGVSVDGTVDGEEVHAETSNS